MIHIILYIMDNSKTETKQCGCSDEFHRGVIIGLCVAAIIVAIVALCI